MSSLSLSNNGEAGIPDTFPDFHISILAESLDKDNEDIFPHFHTSTLPELLDKDDQDTCQRIHLSLLRLLSHTFVIN